MAANSTSIQSKPEQINEETLNKIIITGDVASLSAGQKVAYITALCKRYELDPITRPFDLISQSGKEKLYANRSCTDQIRESKKLSGKITDKREVMGVYIVEAEITDGKRTEPATGAVWIKGLTGDALANAMMKAETKAKRRATLSFVGLALPDESEVETIPGAVKIDPTEKQELKVKDTVTPAAQFPVKQDSTEVRRNSKGLPYPTKGKYTILDVEYEYAEGINKNGDKWASFRDPQGVIYYNNEQDFKELLQAWRDSLGEVDPDSVTL